MTALFETAFGAHPVMGIFRGLAPPDTVARARAAWASGAVLVEVPVQAEPGWAALEAVLAAADGRPVGVGTVVHPEQVDRARETGATFCVSPGWDPEVHDRCRAAGLPHLPGVATAGEVSAVVRAGSRWVKAFPASVLGPAWVSAMLGPFPDLAVVATGGLTASDWPLWRDAGARGIAVGKGWA